MKKQPIIILISILIIIAAGYIFYLGAFQWPDTVVNGPISEKRAVNFIGSQPAHGSTMDHPPKDIIIMSEDNIRKGSSIYITRTNARELGFGEGETMIDSEKHSMRLAFSTTLSPSDWKGTYTVTYKLCGTYECSSGQFQFTVTQNQ